MFRHLPSHLSLPPLSFFSTFFNVAPAHRDSSTPSLIFPPLPSAPLPDLQALMDFDRMTVPPDTDNASLLASLDQMLTYARGRDNVTPTNLSSIAAADVQQSTIVTTSSDMFRSLSPSSTARIRRTCELIASGDGPSAHASATATRHSARSAMLSGNRDTSSVGGDATASVSSSRSRRSHGQTPDKRKRSREQSKSPDRPAARSGDAAAGRKRRARGRRDASPPDVPYYRIQTPSPPVRTLATPPILSPSSPPPLSPIRRRSYSRQRSSSPPARRASPTPDQPASPGTPPSQARRRRVARIVSSSSAASSSEDDTESEASATAASPPRRVSPLRLRLRRQTPPRSPSPASAESDGDTSFVSESSRPTSPEWSP